jgi:tellurite resistance protein TehA-like permease
MPITYTPMLWGLVFPRAMYAVATYRLSDDFPPLRTPSDLMSWIALVVWFATAVGLITASARSFQDFARSAFFAPTR